MKYSPHKSSIFDLDANLASLLIYLLPWLVQFINNNFSSIAWIIPLVALFMETKSNFVRFHAANALSFYLIQAILHLISSILGIGVYVSALLSNFILIGTISLGITTILMIVVGFVFSIISILLFIGKLISLIKAYNYEEIQIPIIYNIAQFILNLKH